MTKDTLSGLLTLNRLMLTEGETAEVLELYDHISESEALLTQYDASGVEIMVHPMPMINVLRDDISQKDFTRDELQLGAPEKTDGYWQVPRLVE